ncbi:MAG: Ig-like domain-containing protein [Lachnospiraceae bacterium]
MKLNKLSATIYKNQTLQLKAVVTGSNEKVTWKSGDSRIAAVNSAGKVTGKKAGTVTITAKAGGKTAKCKVTVKEPSIKLNKTSVTIYTSGTTSVQLKATVKGASSKVAWASSDKKIAVVDSKGKVTAKKTGTAVITAKANGKTAKCKVTVSSLKSKYISYIDKNIQNPSKYTYAIRDINGDKVPELILKYENGESFTNYYRVYIWQNNKVVFFNKIKVGWSFSELFYSKKYNDVVTYFHFADGGCYTFYSMKKKNFEKDFSIDWSDSWNEDNEPVRTYYYNQNEKEIAHYRWDNQAEKKAAFKKIGKYTGDLSEIVFKELAQLKGK